MEKILQQKTKMGRHFVRRAASVPGGPDISRFDFGWWLAWLERKINLEE
jgi:hypothetical protein